MTWEEGTSAEKHASIWWASNQNYGVFSWFMIDTDGSSTPDGTIPGQVALGCTREQTALWGSRQYATFLYGFFKLLLRALIAVRQNKAFPPRVAFLVGLTTAKWVILFLPWPWAQLGSFAPSPATSTAWLTAGVPSLVSFLSSTYSVMRPVLTLFTSLFLCFPELLLSQILLWPHNSFNSFCKPTYIHTYVCMV